MTALPPLPASDLISLLKECREQLPLAAAYEKAAAYYVPCVIDLIARVDSALALSATAAQAPHDQTALELCSACGWKTLIPGDCCLNCERERAAQAAANAAQTKDALLQAAIDFVGDLTGMSPPPIETAPPEVFAPFHAFVERVILITGPVQPTPLPTKQIVDAAIAAHPGFANKQWQISLASAIERAHGIGSPGATKTDGDKS